MRDVRPCAHRRDPRRQRIDISLDGIEPRKFSSNIAMGKHTAYQMFPQGRDKTAMMFGSGLAKVRKACDLPKPGNAFRASKLCGDLRHICKPFQHGKVDRFRRGTQRRPVRLCLKIGDQLRQA